MILIFCFLSIGVHAHIATSLKAFGSGNNDFPLKLVTDIEGNSYLAGSIEKGSRPVSFENIPGSKEGSFIAKLDKSKKIIWFKNFDNATAIHSRIWQLILKAAFW
jgi:hypothetical protein